MPVPGVPAGMPPRSWADYARYQSDRLARDQRLERDQRARFDRDNPIVSEYAGRWLEDFAGLILDRAEALAVSDRAYRESLTGIAVTQGPSIEQSNGKGRASRVVSKCGADANMRA